MFLKTILVYYGVASAILIVGYFFPARTEYVLYLPINLSLLLLIPLYLWQMNYRKKTKLPKETTRMDKRAVVLRILALFALVLTIRIPFVLLFNEPYEKTPLIYLLVLAIILLEKTDLETFGFKTRGFAASIARGVGFFALLGGLGFGLSLVLVYMFTGQTPVQSFDPSISLLLLPFMTFCVGISEEGLFRGYMQTHLERLYTTKRAIVIQAVLFGLWHFVWDLSPLNLLGMAQYVASTFFIGLIFGYFYSKTRNLVPVVLAHGLWNSLPSSVILSGTALDFYATSQVSQQIIVGVLPFVTSSLLTLLLIRHFYRKPRSKQLRS